MGGRGAFCVVRSGTVRSRGRRRSENVGTSSDKTGEKPVRRKPEVSWARLILPGSVGPKPRPRGVGEGKRVNIPHLDDSFYRRSDAEGYVRGNRDPVPKRYRPTGKSVGARFSEKGNPKRLGLENRRQAAEKSF